MSQFQEDVPVIKTYEEIKLVAIPNLLDALSKCELIQAPLFGFQMPDKLKLKDHVEVNPLTADSISDIIEPLRNVLMPHYRSESSPYPTRLIGFLQITGKDELVAAAKEKAVRLNSLKEQFGDQLKEMFPNMRKRSTFLREQFQSMSSRSVQRQLIIGDSNTVKFTLHWTEANTKAVFREYADIPDILAKFNDDNTSMSTVSDMIDERVSHNAKDQIVQISDVRAHVFANLSYVNENGIRKRDKHRPGLPLIIFGNQPIEPCVLGNFKANSLTKMNNNKSKYKYHTLYEPLGLLQRRLSDDEYLEKCKKAQEKES
ncbi:MULTISPECIES: DNA replication terminus site-binding protein [Vibrio]|uniref:DNA replication terminus site-binding protein n=1 Tax=Vibrio tasmaniensis TaxID=212663 RepID=A0A2N7NCT6_9VIBR|nr:DNA replication terminus site-binding protein [Vibrio tasmaniensis]PMO89820.1 hypothetical protein BCT01_00630 [Vibrio tasmaniensis]PMP10007.1 hypothetical protein BCS92_02460 [Vibrio tasmaniensis]TKG32608.1 hypothetical protein FC057_12390 [Vibrio tasmaniensis]TKG41708.1 hypothetical protein FC063_07550 [Vibrio tasmaniensis]TKG52063.1 hypothetical protein FC070_09820 [Vibrio tasmaniensis]